MMMLKKTAPAKHVIGTENRALQSVSFYARGRLDTATVQKLRECLSDNEGSQPLMQDVQAIMYRYYRTSAKIANAVLTLETALNPDND